MKTIRTTAREPKIAVISDLHGEKQACKNIVEDLKKQTIDLIVLPGDIVGHNAGSLVWTIKQFLKLNRPVVTFGGSHENSIFYKTAMKKLKGEQNLVDALKLSNSYLHLGDFDLIMINGCTVVGAGPRKNTGGNMWRIERGANKQATRRRVNKRIQEIGFAQKAHPIFMDDYIKLIEKNKGKPGKNKIVFVHDPPLCKTKKGIDVAAFGQATQAFEIKKKTEKKHTQEYKNEKTL